MKKLTVLFAILLLGFLGIFIWWSNGQGPADPLDKSSKIFVVNKGEGIREIGNRLKNEDLIKDPVVFFLYVKQHGLDNKIQAGDFRLSRNMDLQKVTQALTHGTLDIWITIPEGKRADEVADILKEKMPGYDESWRSELRLQEGYLFPDTYLFPREATVQNIISIMTNTFEKKYAQITTNTNLTKKEIVTLASLVEREAKLDADRPLVASVILNRVNQDMPLQIDATVQYVLGYQPSEHSWWKNELTSDDLKIKSPYNTYLVVGLPPGPISNPGFAALSAAAYPAKTNYLYYISDKYGHNHYEQTLDQHNADVQKYGL